MRLRRSARSIILLATAPLHGRAPAQEGGIAPPTPSASEAPAPASADGAAPTATTAQEAALPDGATPAAASNGPALTQPDESLDLSGYFSLQYRLRRTSDTTDQDLFGLLGADWRDAERDPFSVHVATRASWDVDGRQDRNGSYAFDSLADSYDHAFVAHLLEGWAGGRVAGLGDWRLGRFFLEDTPVTTYMDGARIATLVSGPLKARVGGYGGLPSHLYESSSSGDRIYGAFAEARGWTGGRSRFDWMHVDDELRASDREDDLLALSHWQALGERVDLFGRFTWIASESRDLTARAGFHDAESALRVQLGWYELFNEQTDLSYEFDPFTVVAFDYQPYRQASLLVGKGLGDHFDLAAGVDVRRLNDDDLEAAFNHEFERWFVVPSVTGWPSDGTSASATFEVWDAGSERYETVGGDLDQEIAKGVTVGAFTSFALYRYDLYQARELDRVRSWGARLDWRATKLLRLRLDWTFEDDRFDRYQTARVRATWNF